MNVQLEPAADEVARLRRCLNDLVSVTALPAAWADGEAPRILGTLVEALLTMLDASLVYARVAQLAEGEPVEVARINGDWHPACDPRALGLALEAAFGGPAALSAGNRRGLINGTEVSVACIPLGVQGELGFVVAGAMRPEFPDQTDQLILDIGASQAAVALQHAHRLGHQISGRRRAEAAQRDTEHEFRLILDSIPGLVALLTPTGEVAVANSQLLKYFGQSLDELKQWGSNGTVHPDDLARVAEVFMSSVRAGTPYDIVQRLRRGDGVYRWMQNRGFPLRAPAGEILRWCVLLTDIDDQKRAEDALRESEREARRIVDTIPGLVVLLTESGEVEFVSQRTTEYLGLELAASKEWASNGIVNPDDIPRVLPIFVGGVTSGEPFDYEVRLRHFEGSYRWFQLRARPHREQSGRISRWYLLLTDIDEQKRAEQALRESEREAKLIVDTLPGLVVILGASGVVDFENARTREYLGPELAETGAWASNGIVHPADLPRVFPIFGQGVESGLPFEYEVRLRHVSGVYRWFQLRAHPLRNSNGDVARWYVLLSDIDDRKRAEDDLKRSEVFLAEGQRISSTGTFAWQVNTDEWAFSEQLHRIFELDSDTTVTFDHITTRVHPGDLSMLAERMAGVRQGCDVPEYEIRLQMPDGRVKHARVFGRVFRHADGRLECVGAVQDVTQRRLAEDARDTARAELAQVTRVMSLSALTASIAHEVNQPLAGIITNASTCLRLLAADPPDVDGARETARRTIRDGNRASDVVARLRALFSNRQFTSELFDLNEAAREVVALSQADLTRHHVSVQLAFDDSIPPVVGDRVQLQQVILNLLRNATDAMAGIDDRPRSLAIATARDAGGGVRLAVRDSGRGVESEDLPKVFDSFFTTKVNGMGIGLSVSRSIIERHSGRIWAEQNHDHGSTFAFTIPLQPEGATDVPHPMEAS